MVLKVIVPMGILKYDFYLREIFKSFVTGVMLRLLVFSDMDRSVNNAISCSVYLSEKDLNCEY